MVLVSLEEVEKLRSWLDDEDGVFEYGGSSIDGDMEDV